ncbi:hypothetical protein ACTXG6_11520 [Pseudonocardia sp. Cha107L01]|uniref:hypothetical protein n=1 Tax=Pseudonocardia sp. Cha107L01 TaxID=3457576 RepID=UPI00403EB7EB
MAEDLCYDDGSALQALHDQVYGGPGVGVVESAAQGLGVLEPWVTSSSGRIQQSLRGAGVDWHGQAADATAAALQKVGQWADKGGQATGAGGGRVQDYASSFAEMKPKIVAPAQVPDLTTWGRVTDIFGTNSDHAKVIQQNQEAEAAAFAAYAAHERNTQQAIADFPSVDQVPPVTGPAGAAPIHPAANHHIAPGTGGAPGATGTGTHAGPGAHTNPGGTTPGAGGGTHPGIGAPATHPADPTGTGPAGGAPVTAPSSWTPLNPAATAGPPPLGPAPTGHSPSYGAGFATPSLTPDLPPLPPISPTTGNPYPGAGRFDTSKISAALGGPEHQLAPRGGSGLAGRAPAGGAELAGAGAGGGRGAPGTGGGTGGMGGGMPMGGPGAGGQDREHRNTTFIPSDEPYVVDLDDDVVPAVLDDDENRP